MELFNVILQKTLYPRNTNEELCNVYVPTPESRVNIFATSQKYNDEIIIYKNPKYKDYLFYLANALLFYEKNVSRVTTDEQTIYDVVSIKYHFLKKNIRTFMETVNNDFIDLFSDVQKHYMAFGRFANIWKHKKSIVQIDHDLYMTPLTRNSRNVFSLLQNGKIYLFNSPNLVNIICTSLSNAPNFFVEPLVIKNPYNNVPLTKSDLYNIYFFIKKSPIIMPVLFHNYFMVDFDLRKFRDENENVIKNIAFESYVRNSSAINLYVSAIQMLKKYQKNIIIHKDFPKETLIHILRPYLLLYYSIEYSSEEHRVYNAEEQLKYKLARLYHYNPTFGRKIVKVKSVGLFKKIVKTTKFSSSHPYFNEPITMETYRQTHLEIIDANYSNNHNAYGEDEYENEDEDEDEDSESTNGETEFPFIIVSPHPSFAIQNTLTVLHTGSSDVNVVGVERSFSENEDETSSTGSGTDSGADCEYETDSDEEVIEGDSGSESDSDNE